MRNAERGLNSIEIIAVTLVAAITMLLVVPSHNIQVERQQIKALTTSLYGFVKSSQSLSVATGKDLVITQQNQPPHSLLLKVVQDGELISRFSLTDFPYASTSFNYANNALYLYGRSGKLTNGHIAISAIDDTESAIKIVTSYGAGRIIVCTLNHAEYGHVKC